MSYDDERAKVTKCKKPGCERPPAKHQVYCCRDHAPYGYFTDLKMQAHGQKRSIYHRSDADDAHQAPSAPDCDGTEE